MLVPRHSFILLLLLLALPWAAHAQAPKTSAPTPKTSAPTPKTSAPTPKTSAPTPSAPGPLAPNAGCTRAGCHAGIESIREPSSAMMHAIIAQARPYGDAGGCIVCHGGNPAGADASAAHRGAPRSLALKGGPDGFYPDPGSPWINARSCGPCHPAQVFAQHNSLMMTEAGKIQGVDWAFGAPNGYLHRYGNYAARNPADPQRRLGTARYRRYMARLSKLEPQVFVPSMEPVPRAPSDAAAVAKDPRKAGLTYLRSECQRCHLGVRGRQVRGDYRGLGCSACHIPYGNEGYYEGGDRSIARRPGHLLTHQIQSTRKVTVTHRGVRYSGIPVETCTTCHDRGKRIGVSFQGLMESAYGSPFGAGGSSQPKLHTKRYLAMHQDIHYQKGMLCMDCHSSIDVHGDGFLFGANLAQVEIECADCHGTPTRFPWELPLGFGDELGGAAQPQKARGSATGLPKYLKQGTHYPAEDGYLLSARGNPYPNVVRRGQQVVVHTAGGKDLLIDPLKLKLQRGRLSKTAQVAMVAAKRHIETMECYACHSSWAPQCYGCHVKIDYSKGKSSFDWVAAGRLRSEPARRAESREAGYPTRMPGAVEEQRSYMRWEDPMLVVNGEGRVSPGMPGCQVSVTVIGKDGEPIIKNKIFRTPAHSEGGGAKGQLSLDISPVMPHTTGKARSCESCHNSAKALGYGIGGGTMNRRWDQPTIVDLATADQQLIPGRTKTQIEPIVGLKNDWSQIVDEQGNQQMTVGHHFKLSRPLNNEERQRIDRRGVCLSCHQEIPNASVAINLLHHMAEKLGQLPTQRSAHDSLLHKVLLLSAWVQLLAALGAVLALLTLLPALVWWRSRRRRGEPRPG